MSAAYELHDEPPRLDDAVMVVYFTGWIDASAAAATVVQLVREHCSLQLLATFDPDRFIDYRARRPVMELRDGVVERLVWSSIELLVGADPTGRPVVVLTGAEPDAQWRSFAEAVVELGSRLGVTKVVSLGAYPFATPHTRPTRIACTATSADVVRDLPYHRGSADVPAGATTVLEQAFAAAGIPGLGLWAQVPHYVSSMSYPAASVALVDALRHHSGIDLPAAPLRRDAVLQRQRIDQLVSGNDEHESMVRQMELAYDRASDDDERRMHEALPSGDDIAAELERFLREQGS